MPKNKVIKNTGSATQFNNKMITFSNAQDSAAKITIVNAVRRVITSLCAFE
ncbi:MAG: hypothetical protein KME40_07950 [Komarekiella atlantica HA4396-MV6]|jgi:hypothetical protein|nr:hypothetical protein [Komarekiella atlantica HA4396-MV6]